MNNYIKSCQTSKIVEIRDNLLKKENPLRLESGEPYFNVDQISLEYASEMMNKGNTHYVDSQGIRSLREEICHKLDNENLMNVSPEDILVTNGGMHGLYVAFSSMLNPGDEVLIPTPNWTCVHWLISMTGAIPITFDLKQSNGTWKYDKDTIKSKITSKTKAILVNSPHNPTGHVMTEIEKYDIYNISKDNNLFIVSDEAYEHIHYLETKPKIFYGDNVINIFTCSKSYNMTGLRLGYMVVKNKELKNIMKKSILYTTNGISTFSQYCAESSINNGFLEDNLDVYEENRNILVDAINESSCLQLREMPQGAFYLFPEIINSKDDFSFALDLVETYKLGCVPGSAFGIGGSNHVRFSYACKRDDILSAAEIIKNL